jgi:MFS family permease
MGLSAVMGPIIAGVLIDADLFGSGWRMVFLINLPVGIVASALAFRYLPRLPKLKGERLDILGSLLITAASAALIYPLVQGHEAGWPDWMFGLMGLSVVLFGLFAWNERRSAHPVIEPTLFTHRGFVAGLLVMVSFFAAMSGFMLVYNLFVQLGMGLTPLDAGLALTPFAFGKLGRLVLHIGLAGLFVGMVVLGLTVRAGGVDLSAWALAPGTLIAGIGCGLIFPPLFDLILADLGDHEVGTGAGLLNAVQQFGGAAGVAVIGTIFFELLPGRGFADSFVLVIAVAIGCWLLTFVAAFLLPKRARDGMALH